MRYSFALFAAVVAAAPQVQPISQISDGQIQAPPATSAPAVAPSSAPGYGVSSVPVVVPSVSVPKVSSAAVVTPVVPVVPSATPIVPTSKLVTPIVPGVNSTIPSSTGAIRSPSAPSAASSRAPSGTSSGIPQSTGAAGSNVVSFGGLVLAIGAAVFA